MSEEQPTPEDLVTQNELICEKLLGWKRLQVSKRWALPEGQKTTDGFRTVEATPTFTTWAEAGLILDVLQKLSYDSIWAADALVMLSDRLIGALLTPADIRKEALTCIGRLK